MSEQANLTSGFETYRHPANTTFFEYNEEERVDLRASNLPSKEEGLRQAREKIAATFGGERPNVPTPQFQIAKVGSHLADLRALAKSLAEGNTDEDFAFRQVWAEFEQRAAEVTREARPTGAPIPQQTAQASDDMMGYEFTSAGR